MHHTMTLILAWIMTALPILLSDGFVPTSVDWGDPQHRAGDPTAAAVSSNCMTGTHPPQMLPFRHWLIPLATSLVPSTVSTGATVAQPLGDLAQHLVSPPTTLHVATAWLAGHHHLHALLHISLLGSTLISLSCFILGLELAIVGLIRSAVSCTLSFARRLMSPIRSLCLPSAAELNAQLNSSEASRLPRWLRRALSRPNSPKAHRYHLWKAGRLNLKPCLLAAICDEYNAVSTGSHPQLSLPRLVTNLRLHAPDLEVIWNPCTTIWHAPQIQVVDAILRMHLGMALRVLAHATPRTTPTVESTVDPLAPASTQRPLSTTASAPALARPSGTSASTFAYRQPRTWRQWWYPPTPPLFIDVFHTPAGSPGSPLGHMESATLYNARTRALHAASPVTLTRLASPAASSWFACAPDALACAGGTSAASCPHAGCRYEHSKITSLRGHVVNCPHRATTEPTAWTSWLRTSGSAQCVTCNRVVAAQPNGLPYRHGCEPHASAATTPASPPRPPRTAKRPSTPPAQPTARRRNLHPAANQPEASAAAFTSDTATPLTPQVALLSLDPVTVTAAHATPPDAVNDATVSIGSISLDPPSSTPLSTPSSTPLAAPSRPRPSKPYARTPIFPPVAPKAASKRPPTPAAPAAATPAKAAPTPTTGDAPPAPAKQTSKKQQFLTWIAKVAALLVAYRTALVTERRTILDTLMRSPFKAAQHHDDDNPDFDSAPSPPQTDDPSASSWALTPARLTHALAELVRGFPARALAALMSNGRPPLSSAVEEKVRLKYPPVDANSSLPPPFIAPAAAACTFTADAVRRLLHSKSPTTGAGPDGWSYKMLQDLFKALGGVSVSAGNYVDPASVLAGLHALLHDIATGVHTQPGARTWLTTLRGIALLKTSDPNGDVRPIAISPLFVSMATALAVRSDSVQARVSAGVGPTELMHGVSGGVEAIAHIVRAYLGLHPDHVVAKTDTANAFNSVSRTWILAAARQYFPELAPLADILYGGSSYVTYSDRSSGYSFTVTSPRGVNQGCPLASLLYSTALRTAIDVTLSRHPAVTIRGVADDRFFMGPLNDVLDALDTYRSELVKQGQRLQPSKTIIHMSSTPTCDGTAVITDQCAARGYKADRGFLAAGSPIGDRQHCTELLRGIFADIAKKLAAVRELQHSKAKKQDLYRAIRMSIAPASFNYLLRTTPPDIITAQAQAFDDDVYQAILDVFGVPPGDALRSPLTPGGEILYARVHLHVADGGAGIPTAAATANGAYLASLLLTMPIIKNALGDDFSAAAATALYPDLAALLANPTRPDFLAETSLDSLFAAPVPKAQRILNAARRPDALLRTLTLLTQVRDRALLISSRNATWLSNPPRRGPPLSDAQWSIRSRMHLGLQTVIGWSGIIRCPKCSDCISNTRQVLSDAATALYPDGSHCFGCQGNGENGAKGRATKSHTSVLFALIDIFKRFGGTGSQSAREPFVSDVDPRVDGARRGDLLFHREANGVPVLIDLVIATPTSLANLASLASVSIPSLACNLSASRPGLGFTPGAAAATATALPPPPTLPIGYAGIAANTAFMAKRANYSKIAGFNLASLVPFAMESCGHIHPASWSYLKSVIKNGLSDDPSKELVWTAQNRAIYADRVFEARSILSVALARTTAISLLAGATTLTSTGLDL